MRLVLVVVLAAGLVAAAALTRMAPSSRGAAPGSPQTPLEPIASAATVAQEAGGPVRFRVESVASGLQVPWALAFAPDGRLFFTERPGRIRVIAGGQLLPDPVAVLPAVSTSESGLMGLALDPDFASNGYLYVAYTYRTDAGGLQNRVSRLTVNGNQAGDESVLLDGIPASNIHDGGRLKFGPAGKLFVTTGDATNRDSAQDPSALSGKILRINPDGSIPEDNPFPGSPVFSYGHRNPEGLAFQRETGQLFSTEHGASGNDEVNVIDPGQNYGWPIVQGQPGDPRFVEPIALYTPAIAPTGATFYYGESFPGWKGHLFFTSLRGETLFHFVLGGDGGRQVVSQERLLEDEYGRLRDIVEGPDGYLYFSTSNRDGRGSPSGGDDRILRIVPE